MNKSNKEPINEDLNKTSNATPVTVTDDEIKIFVDEVIRNAGKLSRMRERLNPRKWLVLGIFGGFFIFCLALFFIFITVYFIKHAF